MVEQLGDKMKLILFFAILIGVAYPNICVG